MDTTAIDHVLTTTRSVRKRLDLTRPVGREVILECLEIALQAPSGSDKQAWRFVVVTEPDLKAELGQLYRADGERYLESQYPSPREEDQERLITSVSHLMNVIDQVPALIIPCYKGRPPVGVRGSSYYGSIFPAVWSFMLALRSRGLGSALTTFHLRHEKETASLLGIPYDQYSQVALLPVAYTTGGDFRQAKRQPVEEVVYGDRWNEPF